MSQAQKEKNKLSPKKQVQGNHEGITRPRRLEAQTKKQPEEKRKTQKEDKKSGSLATIKRRGSFQAHSQKKTRTARKKMTEKENKKQSKRTQAPKKPNDLSWHKQTESRGTRTEKHKKREW